MIENFLILIYNIDMELSKQTTKYLSLATTLRRDLHKIPEVSCKEFKTQAYIKNFLDARGITYKVIDTGLYVDFVGRDTRHTIGLRADIDGLPLVEQTDVCFKSSNGCMHACGHDGHASMLMCVCDILKDNKPKCNVRAIFQFGEEGEGGADIMIKKGVIDGVDEIYAMHLDPTMDIGTFSTCDNSMFAGTGEYNITIAGKKSHCAMPQDGIDSIKTLGMLLAEYPSLNDKYKNDSLVHIGKVFGGDSRNIVASSSTALMTIRYYKLSHLEDILSNLKALLKKADSTFKTTTSINMTALYPPLINHDTAVGKAKSVVGDMKTCDRRYTAEDFAFYLEKIAGCMVWVGCKDNKYNMPLHSDYFGFDEKALLYGIEYFSKLIF